MNDTRIALIRERAYQLFLRRGDRPGDATADWLRAEEEIREQESHHRGPARMQDTQHHGKLTDAYGCDVENPT